MEGRAGQGHGSLLGARVLGAVSVGLCIYIVLDEQHGKAEGDSETGHTAFLLREIPTVPLLSVLQLRAPTASPSSGFPCGVTAPMRGGTAWQPLSALCPLHFHEHVLKVSLISV